MVVGFIACGLFVIWLDASYDVIAGEFGLTVLQSWILMAVSTIYVFCSLGIWTFIVGMWKKSVPMTIISSMLFIFLRQLVISGAADYRESPLVLMLVFLLTVIGVVYTLRRNIEP